GTCFVAFVKEKFAIETSKADDDVLETVSKNVCKNEKMKVDNIFEINDKPKSLSTNDTTELLNIDNETKNNKELASISQKNMDSSTESELPKEIETSKCTDNAIEVNMYTEIQSENSYDAKYRLKRKTVKKSLGKVKIESNNPSTVFGQNTKFTNGLVGDFLVIGNEKFQIIKVVNDSELKVERRQFNSLDFEKWQQFEIEPRTKVNGLLDVYSMVFTKYATTNPFGKEDKPLKLTIVMNLGNKMDINNYVTKFRAYSLKLFEKFLKETNKPIDGSLEKTEQIVFDDVFGLVGNISKAISFGWYESIFEYYADLE
ncbi:757_t:CDS:2, partial [Racocetra fulgida]